MLGLEQRRYVDAGGGGEGGDDGPCVSALGCAPGRFCDAGTCTTTPPENASCELLEPEELLDPAELDWTKPRHVVGVLARKKNAGEVPRVQAMRLAVRQINDNGGIPTAAGESASVAMVTCDYGGEDGSAAGASADVAIRAGVEHLTVGLGARVILAASSSSATKTAMAHVMEKKLPVALVSAFSTSPALTSFPDYLAGAPYGLLWRTTPDDTSQAEVLARLVDAEPGLTRLGILYIDDDYGTPFQEALATRLPKLPQGIAVTTVPFAPTDDEAALGAKLDAMLAAAKPPDALLVIGIDGAQPVAAFKALAAIGKDGAFKAYFLADAAKDATSLLGASTDPVVQAIVGRVKGTAPYHSTAPHYGTFANALSAAFGVTADNFSFVSQSYDAAFLAGYGLAWANAGGVAFDGNDVAAGFASLSAGEDVKVGASSWARAAKALTDTTQTLRTIAIDGTSGPLDFDTATGQTTGPMEIWRAKGTSFETCAVCDAGEATCDLTGCATTPP